MTARPIVAGTADPERAAESMSRSARPLYFTAGPRRLFGWLHGPDGNARDIGVIVCAPFGYEAICAYRSVRGLAESAAASGAATLRFDYAGTGDSADLAPGTDQIECWAEDVVAAAAELQRRCGVRRVAVLGVRLGALLGALAAQRCAAIDTVIGIVPVVSGRRYLRELRAFQATMASPSAETPPGSGGAVANPEGLEVSGFALSGASVARLAQIDAARLAAPRHALLVDREDLPQARSWADALRTAGCEVRYLALPGYPEMMSTPHASIVPRAMLAAVEAWVRGQPEGPRAESSRGNAPAPPHLPDDAAALLELHDGERAPIVERAEFYAREPLRFGIVTAPRSGEARRRGVILLNGGATYRIGPNRMYVSLARRWARRGYVVLRLDLAGLGDSATRAGRPDDEVYPPEALADIRAAIDYLRDHYGVRSLTLGGLCAGAYHSLRAAVAGLAVDRILMVNPLTFFWKEGMTLNDLQLAEVVHNPKLYYRHRLRSGSAWRKLLRGEVDVGRIGRILVHRARLAAESTVRDAARRWRLRLPNDLGWELEELAARGVRIVFVFASTDTGVDLLKIQGGSSVRRLGERCHLHLIDGADHIFSQSAPRALMEEILSRELFVHVSA